MKDIDAQAIWEKYALLEGVPECKGYRVTKDGVKIKCGETDPNKFEPGRLKYCKRCRASQKQDRNVAKAVNPPPPAGAPCPGCRQVKPLVLHHDHNTGEFIEYICNDCNLALGRTNDDPSILQRLADLYPGK